jgi:hypothetical protein
MKSKSQKWIEAGKIIADNPNASIKCPECEQDDLVIQDIQNDYETFEIERIIYCKNCGARNILRLNRSIRLDEEL